FSFGLVHPARNLEPILAQQSTNAARPRKQRGMGQRLRPRTVFAQRTSTHDPRPLASIHRAFVAHDKKLLLRMKRVNSGETLTRLRRLKRNEFQFEESWLAGEPIAASPVQRAFAIEQNEEAFHPA